MTLAAFLRAMALLASKCRAAGVAMLLAAALSVAPAVVSAAPINNTAQVGEGTTDTANGIGSGTIDTGNSCAALPSYLSSCWSCQFVDTFVSTGYKASEASYKTLIGDSSGSQGLHDLLKYIFFIWIASQAVNMFFGDGFRTLKTVALRSLLLVCLFFATSGSAWDLFYKPYVLETAFELGGDISRSLNDAVKSATNGYDIDGTFDVKTPSTPGSADLPGEQDVIAAVNRMQQINGWGFWAGWNLFGHGDSILDVVDFLISMPAGLALMLVFGIAFVAFPFFMLDLFLRVFFISAVAPLLIALALLKPTRGIPIAAFKGIMQSGLTVAAVTLVQAFSGVLMVSGLKLFQSDGGSVSTFGQLVCAMHQDTSAVSYGFTKPGYWFLLCAGILSVTAMSRARGIISALIGGFNDGQGMGEKALGLATKVGGMVASTAATAASAGVYIGGAGVAGAAIGAIKTGTAAGAMANAGGLASNAINTTIAGGGNPFAGIARSTAARFNPNTMQGGNGEGS